MAGVSVRADATATLVGNRVTDGRSSGIYACEGATLTLERNVVERNRLNAVEIDGAAVQLVER